MSARRACTSQAPRRISSKRVGSKPYSAVGRPATALNPTFGRSSPFQSHASPPSSVATTRGARSRNFAGNRSTNASGGSTTWSSTETIGVQRSRGSGSGRKVTSVRRPVLPPKDVDACRSSSDIPIVRSPRSRPSRAVKLPAFGAAQHSCDRVVAGRAGFVGRGGEVVDAGAGVWIGAGVEQHADRRLVPASGGDVQGGPVVEAADVGGRAVREQLPHELGACRRLVAVEDHQEQ